MPDLFGLDIAGIVSSALDSAGGLPAATLIKVTPGTRTANDLAAGTNATTASYATTGIVTKGTANDPGTMTRRQRVEIMLLGADLTRQGVEPEVGDRVTIGGVTYDITGPVESDPAAAEYTFAAAGA